MTDNVTMDQATEKTISVEKKYEKEKTMTLTIQVGKKCIVRRVPERHDSGIIKDYARQDLGRHAQVVDIVKTKEGYSCTFLQDSREIYSYLERTDKLESDMQWQDRSLLLELIGVAQILGIGIKTANHAVLRLQIPPQPDFKGDGTQAHRLIALASRKKWDIEVEWDYAYASGWDRFITVQTPVIRDMDYSEIAKDPRDTFEFKGKQYTRVDGIIYLDNVRVIEMCWPLVNWSWSTSTHFTVPK